MTSDVATDFEPWLAGAFAESGPFTALIVLLRIGEAQVTPLCSTYVNVIGAEVDWSDMAADQVDHGGAAATIGDVDVADAGFMGEERAGQVADRAIPLGGHGQLAVRLPRPGDEPRHVPGGRGGIDHQHLGRAHRFDDRGEVPHRVEAHAGIDRRVDGERVGPDHQRQPIRPAAGDQFEGEVAAGAGMVLDHHGLPDARGKVPPEQPGEDVLAAARRHRHNDADGPVRRPGRGLGDGEAGQGGHACEQNGSVKQVATRHRD